MMCRGQLISALLYADDAVIFAEDEEDTEHFVMRCEYVVKERKRLENLMSSRVKGWCELGDNEKVVRIMDRACCDEAVARAVESIWKKRFVADAPIPDQT